MELWGALTIVGSEGETITSKGANYIGYIASAMPNAEDIAGIGLVIENVGEVKITEANAAMSFVGSFFSISEHGANLTTGVIEYPDRPDPDDPKKTKLPINFYGSNITLENNYIKLRIPASEQYGIYARFA